MSTLPAFEAIREYIEANWTATPLVWENEPVYHGTGAWVRVGVTSISQMQESIGAGSILANRWVEVGSIFFWIVVPVGTGTTVARQHATNLIDLFRGLDLGLFEFKRMAIGLGGVGSDDGMWWELPAEVEWELG